MKVLMDELLQLTDSAFGPELKPKVIQQVAYYENKLKKGSKPMFHIEAMIARIMVLFKNAMA